MKMEVGDCTLKATVSCFVQYLATFACEFSGMAPPVVEMIPCEKLENESMITVVLSLYPLGERLGFRYISQIYYIQYSFGYSSAKKPHVPSYILLGTHS